MTYSVIDVETTGLSAGGGDRVLEIGIAQLLEDGSIMAVLDTLVNPEGPVRATHVHGINQEMVIEAPLFRDIVPQMDRILDGTVIAAHNASFDLGFLREEYRRSGMKFPQVKPACTLVMARRFLAALPSRSLESCRRHLGITDEGAHNALADALATAELLRYFLQEHNPETITEPYMSQSIESFQPDLFGDVVEPVLKPRASTSRGKM